MVLSGRARDTPTPTLHPTPTTWLAAAVEILVAVAVVALLARTGAGEPTEHHHHGGMPGMSPADGNVTPAHGTWLTLVAGFVAVAAAIRWMRRRNPTAGILTAVGLSAVALSPLVRTAAAGSHLVLMVVVEVATTAVPLVVVLAWGRRPAGHPSPRRWPYVWIAICTVAYVTLLIGLHLPTVHDSVLAGTAIPWWAVAVAAAVGTSYWLAILRTPAPVPVRRAALIIGQEVAAMIGLITVLGGGAVTAVSAPATSGMPPEWDHRLGGVVMLAACVAVSAPMLRRLRPATTPVGAAASAAERHP